jgi:hypothetical protein
MDSIRVRPKIFILFIVASYSSLIFRLLLCSYTNQSPVPPVRSIHPSVYPVLDTTLASNANPFDDNDDNDDNETSLIDVSTNNG